jgi:hypothetical protein
LPPEIATAMDDYGGGGRGGRGGQLRQEIAGGKAILAASYGTYPILARGEARRAPRIKKARALRGYDSQRRRCLSTTTADDDDNGGSGGGGGGGTTAAAELTVAEKTVVAATV